MTNVKPRFIYPPHPSKGNQIPPEILKSLEKERSWIAQRKFNGSHAIIWVYQDQVMIWNRHGSPFTTYILTEEMKKCFLGLDRNYDTEYVFDGELLHTKAKSEVTQKQAAQNVIVLFDILYADRHLNKETTLERLEILHKIAKPVGMEPKKRASLVSEREESQVWLAETFYKDFTDRFYDFYERDQYDRDLYPEIEGLVLKLKNAQNTSVGTKPNDVDWIIRCRKTKKKVYQF